MGHTIASARPLLKMLSVCCHKIQTVIRRTYKVLVAFVRWAKISNSIGDLIGLVNYWWKKVDWWQRTRIIPKSVQVKNQCRKVMHVSTNCQSSHYVSSQDELEGWEASFFKWKRWSISASQTNLGTQYGSTEFITNWLITSPRTTPGSHFVSVLVRSATLSSVLVIQCSKRWWLTDLPLDKFTLKFRSADKLFWDNLAFMGYGMKVTRIERDMKNVGPYSETFMYPGIVKFSEVLYVK